MAAALQVDYAHGSDLRAQPAAWWQDVLAVVRFDGNEGPPWPAELALTEINAPVLAATGRAESANESTDETAGAAEIWRLPGPMHSGQHAGGWGSAVSAGAEDGQNGAARRAAPTFF